jgi:hypothetical protein
LIGQVFIERQPEGVNRRERNTRQRTEYFSELDMSVESIRVVPGKRSGRHCHATRALSAAIKNAIFRLST